MSYSEILNAINNAKRNEGFDAILRGGKFLRWTAIYDNGYVYTVWSSANNDRIKFTDFDEAKKYAIKLLNQLKSELMIVLNVIKLKNLLNKVLLVN